MIDLSPISPLYTGKKCVDTASIEISHMIDLSPISPLYTGKKCVDTASTPIDCLAGEYSPLGTTICIECPDGYYNTSNSAASCDLCPVGQKCPTKNSAPVDCNPGEYR